MIQNVWGGAVNVRLRDVSRKSWMAYLTTHHLSCCFNRSIDITELHKSQVSKGPLQINGPNLLFKTGTLVSLSKNPSSQVLNNSIEGVSITSPGILSQYLIVVKLSFFFFFFNIFCI